MPNAFLRVLAALSLVAALALAGAPVAAAQQGQPKVIQLEEIKIEGRVQKPNAFYILNRSNIGYEVMDLRTSFVRNVIRSVQKEPF
jgi:hypothetical protein